MRQAKRREKTQTGKQGNRKTEPLYRQGSTVKSYKIVNIVHVVFEELFSEVDILNNRIILYLNTIKNTAPQKGEGEK